MHSGFPTAFPVPSHAGSLSTPDQSSIPDAILSMETPNRPPSESLGVHSSQERVLRIATRESPLAMWQAEHVAARLGDHSIPTQIVPMVSSGDVDMRPIDGKRSVGVFTKRIQQALLDDEGDIAVHSMKDLPTEVHPELDMVATLERETVADCLVSPAGVDLDSLPQGARIGTGSRRRGAQLLRARPDLKILPIRGNVQTRLKKMHDGEYDAIVLADAGLERLAMHDLPRVRLSLDMMLPAPGQGALAIEVRRSDELAVKTVSALNLPAAAAGVAGKIDKSSVTISRYLQPIGQDCIAKKWKSNGSLMKIEKSNKLGKHLGVLLIKFR